MKISEVRINKFEKNNVKGFATVTFDGELVVTGFKILDGKNGQFVAFPNSKGSDGNYHDNVFPLSKKGREVITNAIIDAYNKTI